MGAELARCITLYEDVALRVAYPTPLESELAQRVNRQLPRYEIRDSAISSVASTGVSGNSVVGK